MKKLDLLTGIFCIFLCIISGESSASTVTFKWEPNTSLDGSSGLLSFEVPRLTTTHGAWNNQFGDAELLGFEFFPLFGTGLVTFYPGGGMQLPTDLGSDGYAIRSPNTNLTISLPGKGYLKFQSAPRSDLVYLALLNPSYYYIHQGTWAWSSTTISPIPEPQVYALLMAGLGLVGVVAKRRRRYL